MYGRVDVDVWMHISYSSYAPHAALFSQRKPGALRCSAAAGPARYFSRASSRRALLLDSLSAAVNVRAHPEESAFAQAPRGMFGGSLL